MEDSPSLKRWLSAEELTRLYTVARKEAAIETELALDTFPTLCPYTVEDVLNEDFPADLTN